MGCPGLIGVTSPIMKLGKSMKNNSKILIVASCRHAVTAFEFSKPYLPNIFAGRSVNKAPPV